MANTVNLDYFTINAMNLHDLGVSSGLMLTKVSGLFGMPAPRDTSYDRPEADGSVELPNVFLKNRIIIVEGAVFADGGGNTAQQKWHALQTQLYSMVNTAQLITFRANGSGLDLQCLARMAGDVQYDLVVNGPLSYYVYQATFRCSDPWIYSQALHSVSAAFNTNTAAMTAAGDGDSWPLFIVTGPCNVPGIVGVTAGRTLTFFTLNITAGQTLTVDSNPAGPRSAVLSTGANELGALSFITSDFFALQRGAGSFVKLTATGGTTGATGLQVQWRDRYLTP